MSLFNIGAGGGGNAGDVAAGYIVAPHLPYIGDFQFCAEPITISSGTVFTGAVGGYRHNLIYGSFPLVSKVGQYAFLNQGDAYVYLPALEFLSNIGGNAFTFVDTIYLSNLSGTLSLESYASTAKSVVTQNPFYGCKNIYVSNLLVQSPSTYSGYNTLFGLFGYNLQNIDFTMSEIPESAFMYYSSNNVSNNISLTTATIREATTIGPSAFCRCTALAEIYLLAATTINRYAFYSCRALQSISLPQATTIGSSAFYSCRALQSISLPQATIISAYAFERCGALQSISLPQVTTIDSHAFGSCDALQIVSLPQVTSLSTYVFYRCSALSILDLTGVSTIPTLGNYTFDETPIYYSSYLGYYGSIYVPASLYNNFTTATNWTKYSARMVSV